MRLESEGRGRKHLNSLGPVPTAWVASLVKAGDVLAHLAFIPGLYVTSGMKAKHVGCGERPGKGLGGMYCSGPNHLAPGPLTGGTGSSAEGKTTGRKEAEWRVGCRLPPDKNGVQRV